MNINTAFPSKYLKAADLNGSATTVTIERVELEDVGQGAQKARKPVVYFVGKQKAMVLNKTNATMIAKIAGSDDTDHWTGTVIRLIAAEVEFQGELTQALRVREAKPANPPKRPVQAEPMPVPSEDEIPF